MTQKLFDIGKGALLGGRVSILVGSGAPGLSDDTLNARPGSLYLDDLDGGSYRKVRTAAGTDKWELIGAGLSPKVVSGVQGLAVVDQSYAAESAVVKWLVDVTRTNDPASRYLTEITALHDGSASADATRVDWNDYGVLHFGPAIDGPAIDGLAIGVRLNGSGSAQVVELTVAAEVAVDVVVRRADLGLYLGAAEPLDISAAPHAATHTAGGTDPLALDAAQVVSGTFDIARVPVAGSVPWDGVTGKPTTLDGYGISDAQPYDANIQAHIAGTSNPHNTTAAQVGAMATSHAANAITGVGATPAALGVANAGTSTAVARTDHVHPLPSATDVGAAPVSHVGAGGSAHATATAATAGFMSATDKSKLDGITAGATAYAHPVGDGNLHVPATGTGSSGKVLKAGATAGSAAWGLLSAAEVGAAAVSHSHPLPSATDVGAAPVSHVGADGSAHATATTATAGFMSPTDKSKLDGITAGATAYTHPAGDGNLHVPATGTGSAGKVLKAGATAGSMDWGTLSAAEVGAAAVSHSHPLPSATDVGAAPASHVGADGSVHATATTAAHGFMSATDKSKLDGITVGATAYVHPAGDGNLHVPATGTGSSGKVLKAGATAGSAAWGLLSAAEVGAAAVSHSHPLPSATDVGAVPASHVGTGDTALNANRN